MASLSLYWRGEASFETPAVVQARSSVGEEEGLMEDIGEVGAANLVERLGTGCCSCTQHHRQNPSLPTLNLIVPTLRAVLISSQ